MNKRLQKKCFIAAAGFHLLMLVILLVGPAFLSSSKKVDDRPPIDFIPLKTIDEALAGGGNPNARPPTPQPPAPQPQPPAPRPQPQTPVRQPDPPKPIERERDVVPPKPTRKLPDVNLKRVTRSNETVSKTKAPPKPNTQPNNRLTQVAKAAQAAAESIRQNVSDSPVEMPELHGPGGGGVPYANFYDAVKKIYSDAWIAPDGAADEDASVEATVTIARSGDVISSRITRLSGNPSVNQSVQATLNRVTRAVPLPDNTKESQRIVPIKFNARAKRGTG